MSLYKEIATIEDWNQYFEGSSEKALLIFKHSTTCPVSAAAFKEFESYLNQNPRTDVEYVLVKVIESRPVSNQIAEDLNVKHESPQAIFVINKELRWHASHWKITKRHLSSALAE